MKIVFLIRSLDKGGAERQLSFLAAGLKKSGYDVAVITFYSYVNNNENTNYKVLTESGVKVYTAHKRSRYDILGFMLSLDKLITNLKPDILYSFLEMANILGAIYKIFIDRRIKLVWGKRSADLELSKYRFSLKLEHAVEKWLSFVPNLIIANSDSGRDYMQARGYRSHIEVVHNGISTDFMDNNKFQHIKIPSITADDIIIGAVGRLDYAKDYETLLEAFVIVIRSFSLAKLVIVGAIKNRDYYQLLTKLIVKHDLTNKVFFLAEMDNISDFYRYLDVFVSSSYTEGFSNVIAEAMLHQLPCVVTNAGDSAFLVGEAGIIVKRRCPQELANGINILLEDKELRNFYARQARGRVIDNFTTEKMVYNTSTLLRALS